MAAPAVLQSPVTPNQQPKVNGHDAEDAGLDTDSTSHAYHHQLSSRLDPEPLDLSSTSSPSQLKRAIEAHLQETDRRLEDTQQLGTSLVKQREELSRKLEEVEQFQGEAQIPNELRRKLADIEKEHADVSREVARALIGPKSKQDDLQPSDSSVFTSQATGSPTKVSAPSRRHRNQPSTRAGDLQFAADISTSLLAQVRQLQATVAERDEAVKRSQSEREAIEQDLLAHSQKIRALDESEQKYKDENWNLETQKHELLVAAKEASDKEKRLNASLNAAVAEKRKLQNDLDELRVSHSKLAEEHTATRKALDTEIHGLKRNSDLADTERQTLQDRIEELMSQNQQLAKAIANRSRSRQISPSEGFASAREEVAEQVDTPEESPPPSPTKATPRHGGLESETLRSSLHHAHRMIQNLKGNIHREKTEKIELRRMLQEARDELETRRSDNGSAAKRQKAKADNFKKPPRPDMLGGNRKPRTDVELTDDDWEDQISESPSHARGVNTFQTVRPQTDLSDAYQTANETEGNFDTADERNTTESEAFMTGAESLAGDSTDELTETEDSTSMTGRQAPGRVGRSGLGGKIAGEPSSHPSRASMSADEADAQTPMQSSFTKFKLRNSRWSQNRLAAQGHDNTPDSLRSQSVTQDSPATVTQSPAMGEQSLFAELGGLDEINSETHSTPARSSTLSSAHSTPGFPYTPSKSAQVGVPLVPRPVMVDSATMTEAVGDAAFPSATDRTALPSAFSLPADDPDSSMRGTDHSTQYTPHRGAAESPIRPTSSHITPPKTVWDEEHEQATPAYGSEAQESPFGYSGVFSQDSAPMQSPDQHAAALLTQFEELKAHLADKEKALQQLQNSHDAALVAAAAELEALRTTHASALKDKDLESDSIQSKHALVLQDREHQISTLRETHAADIAQMQSDVEKLRAAHAAVLASTAAELDRLRSTHAADSAEHKEQLSALLATHARAITDKQSALDNARVEHASTLQDRDTEIANLRGSHASALSEKDSQLLARQVELNDMRSSHAEEIGKLHSDVASHREHVSLLQTELDNVRSNHTVLLAGKQSELEDAHSAHAVELEKLNSQISTQTEQLNQKMMELNKLREMHSGELENLRAQISGHSEELGSRQSELEKLQAIHAAELEGLRRQVSGKNDELSRKSEELEQLRKSHGDEAKALKDQVTAHVQDLGSKHAELEALREAHATATSRLNSQIGQHVQDLNNARAELDELRAGHADELKSLQAQIMTHTQALDKNTAELAALQSSHEVDKQKLNEQIADHRQGVVSKQAELEALQASHAEEQQALRSQIISHTEQLSERQLELASMRSQHGHELESLKSQIADGSTRITQLQMSHTEELAKLHSQITNQNAELEKLRIELQVSESRIAKQAVELEKLYGALQAAEDAKAMSQRVGYSSILSQETGPLARDSGRSESPERPRTAEKIVVGESFAAAGAAFGLGVSKEANGTAIAKGETLGPANDRPDLNGGEVAALGDNSGDARPGISAIRHDQGSQTTITAEQLDQASKTKKIPAAPFTIPARNRSPGARTPTSPTRYPVRSSSRNREVSPILEDANVTMPSSPPPRPSSASSHRTSSLISQTHPPLPSDHRDIIAKANQLGSPSRQSSTVRQPVSMGPPTMPASAMRRPKTPSESVRTASRVGKRATVGSQISRRSSVSSFASELDERFNIRADQQGASHGFEAGPGTDPRMIQAITQTMIGEYLWKYTRKAASKEMSSTRHRRFFWVHPYTKTLYWSTQDPQTAGRNELKAKSVAIESVRVVSDDNPMPPGLHRKSLEVITPGRKIKFTASTAQRHETWFNALSYLLHRGEDPEANGVDATGGVEITRDDIAEFSVNGYGARLIPNDSRMSMSSYNSRTTSGTTRRVGRQSIPAAGVTGTSTLQAPQAGTAASTAPPQTDTIRASRVDVPSAADKDRTIRASSVTRISKMFGSVTNRTKPENAPQTGESTSQHRETSSIYDASIVSDGRKEEEEEARLQRMQEERPGLEDVRACCDGKHNVGSLAHRSVSSSSTQNRLSNAISRSMSRRA